MSGLSVCRFDNNAMMERFLLPIPVVDHLSVADSLDEIYGDGPSHIKSAVARYLCAAEIGGFLIFEDGSEVAA